MTCPSLSAETLMDFKTIVYFGLRGWVELAWAYLWFVGNGGMGYMYSYYYYHSSIPY